MTLCTECYIRQNGKTLMLYRNKKENDINEGKWIGFGGKFEPGESPEECLLREIKEEIGVTLTEYKMRGVVTFLTIDKPDDPMYLFVYTASAFTGEIKKQCDEGMPEWVDDNKILGLDLWEGDKIFWEWILGGGPFFSLKLTYDGDRLIGNDYRLY